MNRPDITHSDISRRVGPVFTEAAIAAALNSPPQPGYPAGWGTSPRPAPLRPATSPPTEATPDDPGL